CAGGWLKDSFPEIPAYAHYRGIVERKFEYHMQVAQEKEPHKADDIAVEVQRDGNGPEKDDQAKAPLRHLVPLNDARLGKPVQVMIGIGKRDEAHQQDAGFGMKDLLHPELSRIRASLRLDAEPPPERRHMQADEARAAIADVEGLRLCAQAHRLEVRRDEKQQGGAGKQH